MKKTSKRYLKNGKNSQRQVERFLILAFQCPLAAQKFDHSFVKFNGIHNITAVVEEKTISLNWKLRIDFAPFSFFLVDVSLSEHTISKMIYFLVCKFKNLERAVRTCLFLLDSFKDSMHDNALFVISKR